MKTRVVLIILAVVVIALGLFALNGPQSLTHFGSSSGSVSTSTITASTTEYTVDAAYPQFGIPAIDSQIKTIVENGVNDLETQADQDKPAENGYPLYSFTCLYNSPYIGSDYISVLIACGSYTGGAHELPTIIGATFDRSSNQPVTLDQALTLTGMTLDEVASSSKHQLAQNPDTEPTGIWASGSDPTPDNYQTFLINESDVTFIFQPYQVAPFSSGAPEVSIPRIK
jgi:peptidoglycan-N-acetylglucosamine deacetylase